MPPRQLCYHATQLRFNAEEGMMTVCPVPKRCHVRSWRKATYGRWPRGRGFDPLRRLIEPLPTRNIGSFADNPSRIS